MNLGIQDAKAIVCASSRGLGKACAVALAREGARVIINGRHELQLQTAVKEIESLIGNRVDSVVGDIATPEGRAVLLEKCPEPDILVTNVGASPTGDFMAWDGDAWREAIERHMMAPLLLIRSVVGGMMARRFGRIVNLTSRAVRAPLPLNGLSNGARAGLTGAVATLARQVAKYNVTINNILPGSFDTDRQGELLAQMALRTERDLRSVIDDKLTEIPAGRFGEPEELGRLCAFLCSRSSGFIVGQNILIDGGSVNLL